MNTENDRTRDLGRVLNRRRIINLAILAVANLLISLWMGQQAYNWMPPQASAESVLVDKLFSFMTAVGTFIFIGVIGTLLYSMVFQRAAKYDSSDGPPIEGNVKLEIVWTVLPIVLVIWIGTVSFQTYDQMALLGPASAQTMTPSVASPPRLLEPSKQASATMETVPTFPFDDQRSVTAGVNGGTEQSPIEVHSRQWSWEFRYPEAGVSSTELHLPVNQRAHFKLTSDDVLHGFFVPAFRVKQDIIPGREIDFSLTPIREGRYRLRDSEYSGTYFAANQTHVVVESPDAYERWLQQAAQTEPAAAENMAFADVRKGEKDGISLGWATVKPAPAPIVNYSSSEQDSHE